MNFDRIIAVRNTKTIYRDGDLCLKVFNEGTSKAGIFNEALNQARAQEAGLNVPSVIQVSVNGGKLMIVSDYVEGKSLAELIKENPEAFPEAASGRLVEKLSKVMNMSKTVVQEYKTVSSNLSDEAMEKFKKNEITKEAAKTLASVSAEEQKKIIEAGVTETKAIKDAVKTIKNPSASEIKSAFKAIYDHTSYTKDVIRKYSSLEECFRDKEGKTHSGHSEYRLSYRCSLRGIAINNRKEITWHEFVNAATEMGLYDPDDIYSDEESLTDEQLPGQDNIYNHPEYLPDSSKEKTENVTESVTNEVINYHEANGLAGVTAIARCPKCKATLSKLTNSRFCGSCGIKIEWRK